MAIGVYKIFFKNDLNKKVYVGISNNLSRRKHDHLNSLIEGTHKNPFLQSAFNKYGRINYVFEVIEHCELDCLLEKEKEYISAFNSFDNKFGYNLTNGGERFNLSQSTKEKLSVLKSGRKLSEKTKLKLVVHNLLNNRPNLDVKVVDGIVYVNGKIYKKSSRGKFRTPEDDIQFEKRKKEKSKWQSEFMRKISTNRAKSKEEIEKIRNANLGRHPSNETKNKIGSYHIGKKISTSHKEGIKENLGHKVFIVDSKENVIEFKSKKDCGKFLNVSDCTINKYINKDKKIKDYLIKMN